LHVSYNDISNFIEIKSSILFAAWRDHWPTVILLPHPSWRNTAWLKKNPWLAAELLPALRARVHKILKE
jgi:uracil-DNA glycosylase